MARLQGATSRAHSPGASLAPGFQSSGQAGVSLWKTRVVRGHVAGDATEVLRHIVLPSPARVLHLLLPCWEELALDPGPVLGNPCLIHLLLLKFRLRAQALAESPSRRLSCGSVCARAGLTRPARFLVDPGLHFCPMLLRDGQQGLPNRLWGLGDALLQASQATPAALGSGSGRSQGFCRMKCGWQTQGAKWEVRASTLGQTSAGGSEDVFVVGEEGKGSCQPPLAAHGRHCLSQQMVVAPWALA